MPRHKNPQSKQSFIDAGLVRVPGSAEDSLHKTCVGCKHVVFWRLLTLSNDGSYCDWCMTDRGWRRMPGSPPLATYKTRAKRSGGE